MVSLAFTETDTRQIVRKAACLIHPSSPYRKCLDTIVSMADGGASFDDVTRAVCDRWHLEYPATNNAVANGGLLAAGVWFGQGDFLETVNLVVRAADFTDSDCNAATAGAVLGALHGMKCLPPGLLAQLHDRIEGDKLGPVTFDPPVRERLSDLARRTAAIGCRVLSAHGAHVSSDGIVVSSEAPVTQEPGLFHLSDLMSYWNRDWELIGAGYGYRGDVRGTTHLEREVLATYPRDEVRGVALRRTAKLSENPALTIQIGADRGRVWQLEVWVDNQRVFQQLIENRETGSKWKRVRIDLAPFAGRKVRLRVYQFVLLPGGHSPGSAYWKELTLE